MFGLVDQLRRGTGRLLDASGLGPVETPFRVTAEAPGWRLRAYETGGGADGPILLIVPAPLKRAYIWDLLPEVSVVRHCLGRGLRVHLLEWIPPGPEQDRLGLSDYADSFIGTSLDAIAAETGRRQAFLAGHSLGGTFAAIYAARHPERAKGLVLVDAPLALAEKGGPLALAVALAPDARLVRQTVGSPVPGSFIDLVSTAAAPHAFLWQRWTDLAASIPDPLALAVHIRAERWTLDEFPLPGRLFDETVESLYRDNRFQQGTLSIAGREIGIGDIRAPVLAVVNPQGGVVPPESTLSGLAAIPDDRKRVLEYEGDRGADMQHLGPLIGPNAHRRLWPEILDWVHERARE
ncbi:MAG: alpha/beta fold hydrolase [Pseudomonadota bacterium]|nr:alpha/beta fold hydrolase [Pseudomonadota bacterium]